MTCRAVIHLLGHEAGLLRQQLALSGHVAQGGAPPPVLLQRVQLHPVEQRLEDGELRSVLIQSKQCSDSDSIHHYICQTSNSREVEYESVSSTEKRKPQLPRLTIPLIRSHVLVFSNRKLRPRCPLAVAGAAVQQGGGPDAISGVYWPAGCCEAPPRPLIRVLPGRPHCLPDSSMLITQCGAVTEGGCPSARRHTEPGGSRTQLTPRNIYIHRNKHFKSLITFNHFSDHLRARSDTSTQRWFCESVHVVGSRCFRPTRVQIAAHMIHQESIIICSFTVKTNFCI